jgi:hypothetical protein
MGFTGDLSHCQKKSAGIALPNLKLWVKKPDFSKKSGFSAEPESQIQN